MNLPIVSQGDIAAVKRLSNSERDDLKSRIKATDPHNIFESAGTISNEDKRRIICPICGNGNGNDHTPVEATRKNGVWLYYCFKNCGFSGDLLKIIAHERNLNLNDGNDFAETLAIGALLIGYSVPQGDYITHRPANKIPFPRIQGNEPPKPAPEYDRLAEARKNLAAFIDAQPDKTFRKLPLETLSRLNWGFLPDFNHPSPNDKNTFAALIIPNDRNGIFARRVDSKDYRNVGALATTTIVPPTADKYLFIVEGAIDGASIAYVTDFAYGIIATGGTSGGKPLLERLQELFPKGTPKPKVILMFDNDGQDPKSGKNPGQDAAAKLLPKLRDLGFVTVNRVICDVSRRDPNKILIEDGEDNLRERIEKIIEDAAPEFAAGEVEMSRRAAEAETHEQPSGKDGYGQHPEIENRTHRQKQRNIPPELLLSEEQKAILFQGNSSDKACARRLIHFFGDRVRYLQLDDSWLTFSRNTHGGGLWTNGGTKNAVLYPFAFELSERLEANATNEHESKLAAAFTSTKKFSSTISMMKSFDSIIIKSEDLDQHAELLNCLNCIVDLTNGKKYEKLDSSLLLTKQANAIFRGINFRDEHVDKFLTSIQPNADTRAALLRYLGYGCTGLIRDHVLQLWRGDGRNGKSTLILLVRSALGTYAVKLPTTAILDTGREIDPNAPTPALSPLEGARLAICDELPRTAHINAALCKTLSGGDEIVIRKLRAECKTIKPTAKIVLNGNFNPSLDDVNDLGLRERIRNVPFNQTFTGNRADPRLTEKLSTDDARSAMLSILVAEACAWYRDGLIESAEMVAAKDEYLTANDYVGEFVDTYCEYGEGFIDLKAFVEKLQAKSEEAKKTPERLLKDMVKNWFKIKGKDNVQYKLNSRTRRAGFYGIHWSYGDEDFDDLDGIAPPN